MTRTFIILLSVCLLFSVKGKSQISPVPGKFFGSTLSQTQITDSDFNVYFNQVTSNNSAKWGLVEPEQDLMMWDILDKHYKYAMDNGFPYKQHNFIWDSQQPEWLSDLTNEQIRIEVEEWIAAYAERYPDTKMIEVVNEPTRDPPPYKQALGGNGETGYDWIIWSYEKARQYAPHATLILNDYDVLKNSNVRQKLIEIALILRERGLIDAIGCQGHFLEGQNAAGIQSALDEIAQTGLDIYITELDINIANDQGQLNKYKDIFAPMWQHPSVKGITLWGYKEGAMWRDDAFMVRDDGSERPAMVWVKDFIQGNLQNAYSNHSLPGKIEAENFDTGGQYIAYFDRTNGNSPGDYRNDDVDIRELPDENGYAVTALQNGEWLQYTLDQAEAGSYNIRLLVSSGTENSENKIRLSFNGFVIDTVDVPFTGSNDTWQDILLTDVVVTPGGEDQLLRLDFIGEGFEIDHFEFVPVEEEVFPLIVVNGTGDGSFTENSSIPVFAEQAPQDEQFDQWTGDVAFVNNPFAASTTVTMPGEQVNIAATYKSLPLYTLTVDQGNGSGNYLENAEITVMANDPEQGYEFSHWKGDTRHLDDPYNISTTLVMPDEDIELEATYREETGWTTTDYLPTDDSFARSDKPDNIYGIRDELKLRYRDPGGSNESIRYTYLKYDIPQHSPQQTIKLAILRVFGYNYASHQPIEFEILLAENTWDEETLTWNNKPPFLETDTIIVISYPLLRGDYGVFDVDITDLLQQNKEDHATLVIRIKDHVNKNLIKFASKENETGYPPPVLKLSKDENPALFGLTVENGTGTGDYPENYRVAIQANAPEPDYEFDQWTGDTEYIEDIYQAETTLTMPASGAVVSANYILSTGMEENQSTSPLIYPNPASNHLYISQNIDAHSIKVFNVIAKLVLEQDVSSDKHDKIQLNIQDLPPGIYLVKIMGAGGRTTSVKFVKE